MKSKTSRALWIALMGVAAMGLLILFWTKPDCSAQQAQQNKDLMLQLAQRSTEHLGIEAEKTVSGSVLVLKSGAEKRMLEQQNTALQQQVHELHDKLTAAKEAAAKRDKEAAAKRDEEAAAAAKRDKEAAAKRDEEAAAGLLPVRRSPASAKLGRAAASRKASKPVRKPVRNKNKWTELSNKTAGTIPPIYHSMSESMHKSNAETCASFREAVPWDKRLLGVAGLFNTGTNLLSVMLDMNCQFKGRQPKNGGSMSDFGPVLWQVPSGKHNFPSWQGRYYSKEFAWTTGNKYHAPMKFEHLMAVVIVKDPLAWINSMCRERYAAGGNWYKQANCPSLVTKQDVTVFSYPTTGHKTTHKTILDFWSEWHKEYYDLDRPRIFMRYEDLLFDQVNALEAVCSCVGGTLASPLRSLSSSPKAGSSGHGSQEQVGRDKALSRYSDPKTRLQRYDNQNLQFIRGHADTSFLMEQFGYFVPDPVTATQDRGEFTPISYEGKKS